MTKLWVVITAGLSRVGEIRVLSSLILLPLLMAPSYAVAASGAHGGHADISTIFWPWMNFIVYVGVLFIILRKPVIAGWRARVENIKKSAQSGQIELNEAISKLKAVKERSEALEAEQRDITLKIQSDSEREARQIVAEGERSAELLKKQAEDLIAAERKQAEVAVRRTLGAKVIELATSKLRASHNADSDRKVRAAQVSKLKELRGEGVA